MDGTPIEYNAGDMKINLFNTPHAKLLKRALNVYQNEHKAIAQNIANANNPNYKRANIDFSHLLKEVSTTKGIRKTQPKHIAQSRYAEEFGDIGKKDLKEKVDVTEEMTELAQRQVKHELVTQILSRYYEGIRTSIAGRLR